MANEFKAGKAPTVLFVAIPAAIWAPIPADAAGRAGSFRNMILQKV